MIYSTRLHFLRERYGLTQNDIATLLKIKKDTYAYGQYEREYVLIPSKHLNTLCNYFDVSFDYVFEFTNQLNYKKSKKNINKELSGKRLKELRKENKITQEKLAKALNISRTTITEYERGKNLIATPFLYDICKKYKISADYLLGKVDEPKYLK